MEQQQQPPPQPHDQHDGEGAHPKGGHLQEDDYDYGRTVKHLKACVNMLPTPYEGQDGSRVTLLYFIASSLDVLGALPLILPDPRPSLNWLYAMHVSPSRGLHDDERDEAASRWGFRGSPFLGLAWNPQCEADKREDHPLDGSHLAMTYTALCTLRVLGDDYGRLDRRAVLQAVKHLQQPDGSFAANVGGSESDVRFVYCAAAICAMLQEWSFDVPRAVQFVLSCQTYEYALAQAPGQEAHGGSTYCALAALSLMGYLDQLPYRDRLVQWLIERQVTGFQDTCYSFWLGASLNILGHLDQANLPLSKGFSMSLQTPIGGFAKCADNPPDVLHTYMALCGLSMMGAPRLRPINFKLGMTERAAESFPQPLPTAREALGLP